MFSTAVLEARTKTRRLFRSLNPANVRNLPLLDPAIGRDPGMRTGAGPQRQQVREIEGEISVSTHGKSTHPSFPSHTALPHTREGMYGLPAEAVAQAGVCAFSFQRITGSVGDLFKLISGRNTRTEIQCVLYKHGSTEEQIVTWRGHC